MGNTDTITVNGREYPRYAFTAAELGATAVRMFGEGHDPLDAAGWDGVTRQATLDRYYAEHPTPEPSGPKYPDVEVQLTGQDGNAFFIIGRVRAALRRAGVPATEVRAFSEDATSGDYDHVIQTAMRWVSVE